MSVALWCVVAAGLLPYFTVAVAKANGGYRNHDPRVWLDEQSGLARRADFAHRNHFEAFPLFAAAVIVAQLLHVAPGRIDALALAFIAIRVIYTALYLADRAILRSCAWCAGLACVLALFVCAA
jgi:uncharacterized MAPEG superfamily protein